MGLDHLWTRSLEKDSWSQANPSQVYPQASKSLLGVENPSTVSSDTDVGYCQALRYDRMLLSITLLCFSLVLATEQPLISVIYGLFTKVIVYQISGNKFGISGVTGERLDHMEEDMRRLTQGLDTLNGVVASLEERLRTSLQEEMNKLVLSLLPKTLPVPCSTVTDVCIQLETTSHSLEEVKVLLHHACENIFSSILELFEQAELQFPFLP